MRVIATVVAMAFVADVGPVGASQELSATARLTQFDQSGIKARMTFVDDGTRLSVNGTATGLDPDDSYISLIYDNGSVPGGPRACEPTDDSLSASQMLLGAWAVDAQGNGTLMAEKVDVRLTEFKTVSVRAQSLGLERVACGAVEIHP